MLHLLKATGVGTATAGTLLATVADPSGGAALAWVGALITLLTAAYPKIRDMILDWRKTEQEQEQEQKVSEFSSYKQILLDDLKQARLENADCARRTVELQIQIDKLNAQVNAHPAPVPQP